MCVCLSLIQQRQKRLRFQEGLAGDAVAAEPRDEHVDRPVRDQQVRGVTSTTVISTVRPYIDDTLSCYEYSFRLALALSGSYEF